MKRAWIGASARALLAIAGVAVVGVVIVHADAALVLDALVDARSWLPLVLLAEVAWIAADLASSRVLLGASAARVPRWAWVQSAMTAYAAAAFLPAGRFAGEVARAAELGPHVGASRATAVAMALHGTHLVAAALLSALCCLALTLASGWDTPLSLLIAASGAWTVALGALFLLGPRSTPLRWLLRRPLRALGDRGRDLERAIVELPVLSLGALGAQLLGRAAQVAQGAVLLVAVGSAPHAGHALVTVGIQLVASNVGDAVPGQAGVLEEGFRRFADDLATSAASAVALALLLRVPRLCLAGSAAIVSALGRGRARAPS